MSKNSSQHRHFARRKVPIGQLTLGQNVSDGLDPATEKAGQRCRNTSCRQKFREGVQRCRERLGQIKARGQHRILQKTFRGIGEFARRIGLRQRIIVVEVAVKQAKGLNDGIQLVDQRRRFRPVR